MSLTDEQCAELYKKVIEDNTHLTWIKDRLEKGDTAFEGFDKRLVKLESEQSLIKGRLGAFILGLTFFISLLVNGILWMFSHLGSK